MTTISKNGSISPTYVTRARLILFAITVVMAVVSVRWIVGRGGDFSTAITTKELRPIYASDSAIIISPLKESTERVNAETSVPRPIDTHSISGIALQISALTQSTSEADRGKLLDLYRELLGLPDSEKARADALRSFTHMRPAAAAFRLTMDAIALEPPGDKNEAVARAAIPGIVELWNEDPTTYQEGRAAFFDASTDVIRYTLFHALLRQPKEEIGRDFAAVFKSSLDSRLRVNLAGNIGRTGAVAETLEIASEIARSPRSESKSDLASFACADSLAALIQKSPGCSHDAINAAIALCSAECTRPQSFEKLVRLVSSVDPNSLGQLQLVASDRGKGFVAAYQSALTNAPTQLSISQK